MSGESKEGPSGPRWWELSGEEACRELKVSPELGLTDAEVQQRLREYGRNEIPTPPGSSLIALILEQFKDLLVLILLGAAVVSFLLALLEEGEDRLTAFVEPAVILVILGCNAAVGVIQETNAEKAIQKLKLSEASHAHVIRGGRSEEVEAALLVPGDIVIVDIGSKVPADIRIIGPKGVNLLTDESALTGESEPAQKHGDVILDKPAAVNQDKRNILFSGTLVVKGRALGVVVLTGGKTVIGQIGSALVEADDQKTPLQEKLDEFGEQLSKVIAAICALVWLINIGHFTDPSHGSWIKGAIYYFKIAVALAVAAIPEGLPAVVTTCLALGTMKMAKKNAIVRSLPSVETLGCTTVICSDKTGTLTTNMMSVQKVLAVGQVRGGPVKFLEYAVSGNSFEPIGVITNTETGEALRHPCAPGTGLEQLGMIASLCNESTLSYKADERKYIKTGASTEAALKVFAEKVGLPDEGDNARLMATADPSIRTIAASHYWAGHYKEHATLEFDRKRKSMSVFRIGPKGGVLMVKGAPEGEFGLLARCTSVRGADGDVASMTAGVRESLNARLAGYAREGLRVLALAYTEKPNALMIDFKNADQYADIESGLTFVGFTCMLDPPRTEVRASIRTCHSAHIRVIVITGDNPETATAICREIGVFGKDEDVRDKVFIGSVWEQMGDEAKQQAVKTASLFSRVEPKHKQELVQLLQAQGEVVAMTGDGVNDATALKEADIGIAMGSGTDVAREASNMVLQDDNFATIVMAVEEGRAIYANTKQFIRYLISSNIGEVACIFLTAAIGMPEALIPVQLLWVNLVTDGLPATALGFNPPDKDVMTKQPRGRTESIINGWMFFRYIIIGIYVGIGTVGGFIWWFLYSTNGPHVSWQQLTHFHDCNAAFANGGVPAEGSIWFNFRPFDAQPCEIFEHDTPSTISLSVLVMIEMFNAMNALSENQSLLRVTPMTNPWVVGACALSFTLHLFIINVPWFAGIFHVTPLNLEEWRWVFMLSIPVFFVDEVLKFVSRQMKEAVLVKEVPRPKDHKELKEHKEEKKLKKDL